MVKYKIQIVALSRDLRKQHWKVRDILLLPLPVENRNDEAG